MSRAKKSRVNGAVSAPTKVTPIAKSRDDDELEPEETLAAEPATPETVTTGPQRLGRAAPEDFWRYVAGYPNKKPLTFYFYRLEPPIDRTRSHGTDAESNIDKVLCLNGKVPDENWLKQKWGSGRYQIRVKDTSLKPASVQSIAETLYDIDEYTEFPPVFEDYRQIVDNNKNASFIQGLVAKKLMFRDQAGVLQVSPQHGTRNNGGAGGGAGDDSVANRLIDVMERRIGQGPGKIEETAAVVTINTMASSFQGIISMLTERLGGKSEGGETTNIVLTLLTQQMQMQQTLYLKMLDMGQAPREGKSEGFSLREALREIKEIVGTVADGSLSGGAAAAGVIAEGPWEKALTVAVQALAPGINEWLTRTARTPAQQPQRRQPPPEHAGGIPATDVSAPGLPAQPAAAAPEPEPQRQAASEEDEFSDIPTAPGAISDRELMILSRHVLKCLQRGIDGRDFALSVDTMDDFASYSRLREAVMNGSVQEQMLKIPRLLALFSPYSAQLDKFMKEFIDYGNPEDGDGGAHTEPPGAPATITLTPAAS